MTGKINRSKVKSYKFKVEKIKIIIYLILTCIISRGLYAQNISIYAKVDNNEITLDEMIVLTININGNVRSIPDLKLPQLKDFDVYSSDRSQSVSIINGAMSASTSFNYVLAPKKEGKFVIGAVEINFERKIYKTEPIPVEVLPSGKKQEVKNQVHQKTLTGESRSKGENVFIETSVNKKRIYLNEQLTLTFRFLTRIRVFGEPEYIPPEKNGFWTEDLPPQISYYEGQYLVTEIKTALFPTTAGRLTIGPATVKYNNSNDPFGFLSNISPTVLKTEPITIDVLPLPEEKLSYFKGAVGIYNIESEINTNVVEAGKPINYYLKIKGKGNIKAVSEPEMGLTEDFKVYPAGSSDNVKKSDYTVQGDKTYEYYIIPKKPGNKIIPGINFTYFNPDIEKYVTLKTNNIPITVKPGVIEETAKEILLNTSSIKEEVRLITKDIRPIKSDINLRKEPILLKNTFLIFAISFPVLIFLFARVYSKHHEQVEFNLVYKRDKRAHKLVQKRLKEAQKLMKSGDKNEYCHLISRSVLGFIGDKLNVAEMGLTSESLRDILKEKNISVDAQEKIECFMDKCDYIQFNPIEPEQGWRTVIFNDAQGIISFLEKQKWLKN